MKDPDFCMLIHICGNSKVIEKYWGEHGKKWLWGLWSQDSKTGCI